MIVLGFNVGPTVCLLIGALVGLGVGSGVGFSVGLLVGVSVGFTEGGSLTVDIQISPLHSALPQQ